MQTVEAAAQTVLDVRATFPDSSLADLYDPLTMPPTLAKAHTALDKTVDLCYRPQPFPNEAKRMEFLFELYDKYTAGMFAGEKGKKKNAIPKGWHYCSFDSKHKNPEGVVSRKINQKPPYETWRITEQLSIR